MVPMRIYLIVTKTFENTKGIIRSRKSQTMQWPKEKKMTKTQAMADKILYTENLKILEGNENELN